jgi:hypothetical protein
MGIEDPDCAFHNEPVEFLGTNRLPESFPKTMQKIENEGFLDLDFLMRTLQSANSSPLNKGGNNPSGNGRNEQSEEKSRPHRATASLLRTRLVMKVLS